MRAKSMGLISVCLLFFSCMGSMQVQKVATNFYENKTFDQVCAAALLSVSDMGFTIKTSEKTSGLIYAQGGQNVLTQNEPPQLNVIIKEESGKIRIDCRGIQPGQLIDYGASKKNDNKFFECLNKNLK